MEIAFNTLLSTGLVGDGDLDEIKRYLSDEYLWRFALMQAISMGKRNKKEMNSTNGGIWEREVKHMGIVEKMGDFCFYLQCLLRKHKA